MVGRFKQDARALRRKTLERGVAEAYDIELGSDLGRMIPAELLAMHHPVLKRDFRRRLLESTVLQYRLRDDEQKGKGPMVVCIDVSSSMQGDKEIWSKAVALTLMDIARRQRRLFRAVMFSSGDVSLKVLDLNRERRYQPDLNKVVEMAEYFPGGGTDFQQPIDAAVELLGEKKLKRGDIVIITDGESQVSPEWLAHLRERKEELDFSIFAVLVDVGSAETSSLAQFADRITSVKRISEIPPATFSCTCNHEEEPNRKSPRADRSRAISQLFNMQLRPEQITFVTPPRWTLARCYVRLFGDNFEHLPHLIRAAMKSSATRPPRAIRTAPTITGSTTS